jgi:hypothetical protein
MRPGPTGCCSLSSPVPALTPGSTGTYGELWQILSGGEAVCEFWMSVNVTQ